MEDLQRRSIHDAIVKRTGYCRRVGCYPHSLETTVGKLVAQTMTDATSILNCEVWQMGHPETDIEAALLKIYRTLLGVEEVYVRDVGSKRNSVWAATRFDPRPLECRSRATLRVLVVATAPRRLHILYLSVRNWTTSEEFFSRN